MKPLECDVLVIGSGAAGLCAAVTAAIAGLDVIVAERTPVLGGTTAWSGGWMWLPRNGFAREAGIVEDVEAPKAYLESVLGNRFDAQRVDAFLGAAPAVVDFLSTNGFKFEAGNGICDIYGELPGAGTGGRSLIAAPFNARTLGSRIQLLRKTKRETALWGMPIQAGADLSAFLNATRKLSSFWHVGRRVAQHLIDLVTHRRSMALRNGVALVARLFAIADQNGVRWLTSANATGLLTQNEKVCGAMLATAGGNVTVTARKAVILATGGFSQNAALRAAHFPSAANHLSLATPECDGSGLALAQSVGAGVDTDVAATGAWCPVSSVRWPDGQTGVFPHIIDRGKPGVIAVRADGNRFVNEADGYHDYVNALLAATPDGEVARSWMICDHRFIRRWGLGIVKPAPFPMRHWIKTGYLHRATTLDALAKTCGISAQLITTVAEYNAHARGGHDPEFGRGQSQYNRNQGDPGNTPSPNLAPIEHGPFYAVEVVPGSFGSFAGIKTDANAQALRGDGSVISGLFAVGADMASVMGGHYPAGGINLGPAITFGYLAAVHIIRTP